MRLLPLLLVFFVCMPIASKTVIAKEKQVRCEDLSLNYRHKDPRYGVCLKVHPSFKKYTNFHALKFAIDLHIRSLKLNFDSDEQFLFTKKGYTPNSFVIAVNNKSFLDIDGNKVSHVLLLKAHISAKAVRQLLKQRLFVPTLSTAVVRGGRDIERICAKKSDDLSICSLEKVGALLDLFIFSGQLYAFKREKKSPDFVKFLKGELQRMRVLKCKILAAQIRNPTYLNHEKQCLIKVNVSQKEK